MAIKQFIIALYISRQGSLIVVSINFGFKELFDSKGSVKYSVHRVIGESLWVPGRSITRDDFVSAGLQKRDESRFTGKEEYNDH